MDRFQTVCDMDDVPEGTSRMFIVGEQPIGIFHVEGQFFALDNRCPHASASLAHGIIENDVVACRIHHWRFCIRDGTYLDEPRPEHNVRCFPTRIVGSDVQVDIGNP